jgi:hypothetical protein
MIMRIFQISIRIIYHLAINLLFKKIAANFNSKINKKFKFINKCKMIIKYKTNKKCKSKLNSVIIKAHLGMKTKK